ncbi:RNA polymerase sigma factor [Bacillus carboniphilus]
MCEQILLQYQDDLHRYCRSLTGTPWDAEDLYQETLVKGMKNSNILTQHPAPKAYLFRVASNAWIDECRRRKADVGLPVGYETADTLILVDPLEVKESVEKLAAQLPPFQAVIFLLVDVFLYSTREVGEMLDKTEGAVKAALHRGRQRLATGEHPLRKRDRLEPAEQLNLIQQFLKAFRNQKPELIARAYRQLTEVGLRAERYFSGGTYYFTFYDPEGNAFSVIAE